MEWTDRRKLIWARSKQVSEKPIATCSHIIKSQRWTLRIVHARSHGLDGVLTGLPDLFLRKDCKTIKSEKKIAVVLASLKLGETITRVYVKQHNALSLARRMTSFFCASAAMRSLTGAATLLERGYATARPVAAVEYRRRGVLLKSFYISEELPGTKPVDAFWRDDLAGLKGVAGYAKRRILLKGLARLFKSLHERGVYHNDLKAANILVPDSGALTEASFKLIDLQGLRKCFFVSRRRAIKNLAQLNRTLGAYLTRTEKLFFFEAYGRYRTSNRRSKRALVRRILDETNRQIVREEARHQTAESRPVVEASPPQEARRAGRKRRVPFPILDRLFSVTAWMNVS